MNTELERIDAHIYLVKYIGRIDAEVIMQARMQRMAEEQGETPYVAIIDATELAFIPFEAIKLRKAAGRHDLIGVIVVGGASYLQMITNFINAVTNNKIEHVKTREEAITRAYEIRKSQMSV